MNFNTIQYLLDSRNNIRSSFKDEMKEQLNTVKKMFSDRRELLGTLNYYITNSQHWININTIQHDFIHYGLTLEDRKIAEENNGYIMCYLNNRVLGIHHLTLMSSEQLKYCIKLFQLRNIYYNKETNWLLNPPSHLNIANVDHVIDIFNYICREVKKLESRSIKNYYDEVVRIFGIQLLYLDYNNIKIIFELLRDANFYESNIRIDLNSKYLNYLPYKKRVSSILRSNGKTISVPRYYENNEGIGFIFDDIFIMMTTRSFICHEIRYKITHPNNIMDIYEKHGEKGYDQFYIDFMGMYDI